MHKFVKLTYQKRDPTPSVPVKCDFSSFMSLQISVNLHT